MKDYDNNILRKIKEIVRSVDSEAEVILYGSRARNSADIESDWDILILTDSPANIKEEQIFRHRLFELELEFGIAISTFVISKNDWNTKNNVIPLYINILNDGVRI